MNRILTVVRLHLVNRFTLLAAPWVILLLALLISIVTWLITAAVAGPDAELEGANTSGAVFALLIFQLVVAVQVIATGFPFALGFGVTRRHFALGSGLLFVLLAAGHALIITALGYLEQAIGGWGLGGRFFSALWLDQPDPLSRWFVVFAAQLLCFSSGALAAAIWLRWRTVGVVVAGALVSALSFGSLMFIGATGWWMQIGQWLVTVGVVGFLAWSLLATGALGAIGHLVLRRATAR